MRNCSLQARAVSNPTDPVLAAVLSTLGNLTAKVANMYTQIKQLDGLTGMSYSAMAPMLLRTTALSLTQAGSVSRPLPSENGASIPGSTTGVAGGNTPQHVSGVSSKAVTKGAMIGVNTKAVHREIGSVAVAASTSVPHHTVEAFLA